MTQKKTNVASSVRTILQAVATVIHHGMVAKHPKGGGFKLGEVKNMAGKLAKIAISTKEIIAALRLWFDQKMAKYNNKALHMTYKGMAEIAKFAGPAPA